MKDLTKLLIYDAFFSMVTCSNAFQRTVYLCVDWLVQAGYSCFGYLIIDWWFESMPLYGVLHPDWI